MSGWKKLAAASAAGGAGLDVDEVFSTYLYDGNSGAQTFVNGLDLAGEGGLVWSKRRNGAASHILVDSERNVSTYAYILNSDNANAQSIEYGWNWSFNSNGYSLNTTSAEINDTPSKEYCSWSFRKAPKFFDIVTWNGNSTARTISHNLGQKPGMILVKALNNVRDWAVWHKDLNTNEFLVLNTSNSTSTDSNVFTATEPTSTEFSIGTDLRVNYSAFSYVAYVFADNNGEGEFGPDSDQDIIKCGSYTGTGLSNAGPVVDVGFEPQFLLIKGSNGNWTMVDSMRGFATKPAYSGVMYANRTNTDNYVDWFDVTPTGFQPMDNSNDINGSGQNYIYMAIRRGSLNVPEDATDVFAMDVSNGSGPPYFTSGFPVDFAFKRRTDIGDAWDTSARLMGNKYIELNSFVDQETLSLFEWDYQNGWFGYSGNNTQSWMWKRAPGYFDTVSYLADGVQGSAFNHNLGVVPEMMWIKKLTANQNWYVYHKDIGNDKYLSLNTNLVPTSNTLYLNSTTPDDTTFTVGNVANNAPQRYINMLFATVPGVSKVGSYTGNGSSSRTIDCGFSNGARFFFIKDTTQAGPWWAFDTERGLGFYMDLSSADQTNDAASLVSANSSGFAVTLSFNFSNRTYIFYAVA